MAEHYYSVSPSSSHQPRQFQTKLRGVELVFATDAGVFSKSRIDTGTKLLIDAVRLSPAMKNILDLGCGYGPIGLTIAGLLPEATVRMSDVNERAAALAEANARLNGLNNVIVKAGPGYSQFGELRFDLIVTNPPVRAGKQVIYPLVEEGYEHLNEAGWFAAVVATKQGAKSFEKKMAEVFGEVVEWAKGSGYRVMAGRR